MKKTETAIGLVLAAIAFNAAMLSHARAAAIESAAPSADAASTSQPPAIAEIVVTAQKRTERLTDVPVAISVTSGKELAARNITSLEQIVDIVPGIKVSSAYAGSAENITLRGVGPANQYNFNTNAPVGVYMDEVYQSFEAAPGVQFFDLQRVEVLKGPQGTLYGRNTTGGLVNFISNTPSLSGGYNGNVEVGYGNRDAVTFEAASDFQLIPDQLAVRAAVFHSSSDGFLTNVEPVGPKTFGADDTWQGRLTILYKPTENFDATLRLYSNLNENTGTGFIFEGVLPGATNVFGFTRAGLSKYDVATNYPNPASNTRSYDGSLTLNWKSGPFKLTSITSAETSKALLADDCDASPDDLCAIATNIRGSQFSEDVRLQYTADHFNLTAGAFYGRDLFDFRANVDFFGADYVRPTYKQTRESYAFYADGTYSFTNKLELIVGVRQTFDREELAHAQTALLTSMFGTPIALTIPTLGPYVPGLTLPTLVHEPSQTTGRVILQYKFTPDVVGYLSASHGYREGAYNGEAFFSPAEVNYVGPEIVDNFEAGLKGSLFHNRLQFTNALFYMPVRGQQVLTTVNDLFNGMVVGTSPELAGLNGYSLGYEFEGHAALTETLSARLAFTLLKTRYDGGQVLNFTNVSGNRFANAPEAALQAGFDWRLWESNDKRLTFSPDLSYTSQYYLDPENGKSLLASSPVKHGQGAFTLLNARITYDQGPWSVSVWGKNLTNQYYVIYNGNGEASFGDDALVVGTPVSFGATLSRRF